MQPLIAGVDEAGRGPLAGPVLAAVVILPPNYDLPKLTDSKKLSAKQREILAVMIQEQAIAYAIGQASVREIDTVNILQASLLAMQRAIEQLTIFPTAVWIDGKHTPEINYPTKAIIGGDLSIPAISAASILAKVVRDQLMHVYHEHYPIYNFAQHKGYGTAEHIQKLTQYGPSPIHRLSFAPVKAVQN